MDTTANLCFPKFVSFLDLCEGGFLAVLANLPDHYWHFYGDFPQGVPRSLSTYTLFGEVIHLTNIPI